MSRAIERFTVTQQVATAQSRSFDWKRFLSVYVAVAVGIGLVYNGHYIIGTSPILWGGGDF